MAGRSTAPSTGYFTSFSIQDGRPAVDQNVRSTRNPTLLHFSPALSAKRARPVGRDPATLRRDLRASVLDGAAYFLMVGIGETYFAAFALAVGAGELAAGLTASLPLLGGAAFQLLSPWAVQRLQSHGRWVIACVALQAASLMPLALGAVTGWMPVWLLYLLVAGYWAGGLGAAPAWNTWVTTLVPARLRSAYFARRSRIGQPFVLGGMLLGGFALQAGRTSDEVLRVFAGMFAIAATARFASAYWLSRQSEPAPLPAGHREVRLSELRLRLRGPDVRLIAYLLAMQLATYISAPFFNPYMLRHLRLEENYGLYAALFATPFLARTLALWLAQRFARLWQPRSILWISGLLVMPLAGLWVGATNIPYLFAVQAIAGVGWALYELAMLLMFFEAVRHEERTSLLTLHGFLNSIAIVIGSVIGGALLIGLGEAPAAYWTIFGLSSALRIATLPLLRAAAQHPTTGL